MSSNPTELILELLLSTLAVLLTCYLLPGVAINNFFGALVVAGVISLLNTFVRPLLILLTIPITLITFGLFLLIINAFLILLAGEIVPGFTVSGFWWALLFSILLTLFTSLFRSFVTSRH
jgi:putative membrane protein